MPDEEKQVVELDEGVSVSSPDTPNEDVTPAEDDGPGSMLEAVTEAMKEEGASSDPGTEAVEGEVAADPAQPDPTADGNEQQADAKAEGEAEGVLPEGDPTEEELKDYSQKANARIRDLVAQRNEASQQAQAVAPILDFLTEHQIPQDDLGIVLDLTARLRHGDFAGFLQGVQPYVDLAQQYTGQALPADLQQQVQQGLVSPGIATELAQRRAELQVTQNNHAEIQRTQQVQQVHGRADIIKSAVEKWEVQTKQADPDYALKADLIRRTSQALMQEKGIPQTPEDAVAVAKAAYAEVNGQMGRLRPQKQATNANPRSTGQQGGSAPVAEPTSMMEAAMQGLKAAQG